MIPVIDSYKTQGKFAFPNRDIDPKLKEKPEYYLQSGRAIYNLYCANQTSWGYSDVSRFNELRLYSTGNQPVDQYKNFLLNEVNESTETVSVESWDDLQSTARSKRMGWSNINWQNLSIAPALMNALHGHFDKLDFDLYVNTIDADSRGLAEDEKLRRMVEAKFADWQVEYKKKAGIPVDEQMTYPATPEEFDMFESEEGFKLAVATTMQKLARHSFEISKWDTSVRKKVIDDLICLKYAAVKDYYEEEEGKWKVKYLDPAYLVAQYSNEFDYNDSDFFGYLHTDWTISRIRQKIPEMTDEQALQLASKCYTRYGNNYTTSDWARLSEIDPTTSAYKNIDGLKIPVFEAWWMDKDSSKSLHYRNRHGRDLVIPLGYDGKTSPLSEESIKAGARKEIKRIEKRIPRECFWVLDTDYVFDYGKTPMPARDGLSSPKAPFHVEQLLQPSIIENIKPILDEITMLYLKYQNSIAMMVENGYAINVSMLQNINYGANSMSIPDVIKMYHQTGRLLYSYQNAMGVPGLYGGGAATPITEIKGGLGERVNETVTAMDFAFKKVEYFTGISLATLGVSPEPNVPASSTKEAMQSTLNSLKPILDAALEIKQSAGESMMRRIQIGIRNNEDVRKSYSGVVSPTDIEKMRLMEGSHVVYGLTLKPKPDSMMKAQFYRWLDEAVANTKAGNVELHTSDKIYFSTRLEAGEDIIELTKHLRYRIKKNQEEFNKQSERNITLQGQVNDETAMKAHQMEMEKLTAEGQIDLQEEMVRGRIKDLESNKQIIAKLYEDLRKGAEAEQGITTTGK